MPKISLLISNFNNGQYFKDCFKSLVSQTEEDWEAIIIDDCSTDDSISQIEVCIGVDARFRFYKNERNMGYQRSTIRAIELSEAPILARLDPDDALRPTALEKTLQVHAENESVGLVYSNFTWCDANLVSIRDHQAVQIDTPYEEAYYNFKGEISHFAAFKKIFYKQTSGIDPFIKRAEDKDLYMKLCEVAPVKHINESLYLYRIHEMGMSTNVNVDRAFYWHWVALVKMSERTGTNLEDLFLAHFTRKDLVKRVKKSRWAKLGHCLGLFKTYKDL
ncbi:MULTISPECIES: glycosyltransferase family 2 protein [Sphingobacterium]|uniref:Glycosyltransferase family 2 protein n=1 Tax=Sphingobacterium populi TaxID=1812824 RepID=A0ABW5UAT6_9SPHI|nr:glycosyltransferase family 2 protein [Sphingobacterium sp. CFCC 11742]